MLIHGNVYCAGILLIDDVLNQTPIKLGERGSLGKAKYSIPYLLAGFTLLHITFLIYLHSGKSKYSIPYLLAHGFSLEMAGYQYIMKKKKNFSLQPAPISLMPLRALHLGFHHGTQIGRYRPKQYEHT